MIVGRDTTAVGEANWGEGAKSDSLNSIKARLATAGEIAIQALSWHK